MSPNLSHIAIVYLGETTHDYKGGHSSLKKGDKSIIQSIKNSRPNSHCLEILKHNCCKSVST